MSSMNAPSSSKSCLLHIYESKIVQDTRLISLSHRAFTVGLCIFFFSVIEQIPLSQVLLQNLSALIVFAVWAHVSSCFELDFEHTYWQKLGSENRAEHCLRIGKVIFKYANLAIFVILVAIWPMLSWLDFSCTRLDTDYYAMRYFFYLLYMVINNIPYSAVDNMQMLVGDGFFLTQIASMLLYNTMSMRAMVFAMAPMLIFQNGKMCFDILTFVKEPFQKTTFVRLIGTHDSVFLLLMFTLLGSLMSVMDALASNSVHLVNLVNIPIVLYQVVKIMDTKQARLANSLFPLVAFVLTIASIYVHLAAYIFVSKDPSASASVELPNFPLYVPKPEPETVDTAGDDVTIEPQEELTYMQAFWARCTLSGLWFFLDWVVYPFWGWIVSPWWNWTIAPILYPMWNCFVYLLTFTPLLGSSIAQMAGYEYTEPEAGLPYGPQVEL